MIDITALPSVDFSERGLLPRIPGVYVVTDIQGVVYVGQATSIRDRWRNHHRAVDVVVLDGVRIAWIEQSNEGARLDLEADLTRTLRPRLNARRLLVDPLRIADLPEDDTTMVGASEAIRVLNIPRTNFYRAVKEGKIPVHEVHQPWNRRAVVKRFYLSEIREALNLEPPPPVQ